MKSFNVMSSCSDVISERLYLMKNKVHIVRNLSWLADNINFDVAFNDIKIKKIFRYVTSSLVTSSLLPTQ